MPRKGTVGVTLLFLLCGCSATLNIHPTLPPPTSAPVSQSKLGIYLSPGSVANEYKEKQGSGIWLGTEYSFSPGRIIQNDLTTLTKRHYANTGFAENSVDKRWDLVVEYFCYPPRFEPKSLKAEAPLELTLRNPHTGHTVDSATLFGRSPKQPGRILRLFTGRLAEKPALEKTLTTAYNDLYRKLDAALARTVAREAYETKIRPYQKRDAERRMRSRNRIER